VSYEISIDPRPTTTSTACRLKPPARWPRRSRSSRSRRGARHRSTLDNPDGPVRTLASGDAGLATILILDNPQRVDVLIVT
jgi:hypothetical protein